MYPRDVFMFRQTRLGCLHYENLFDNREAELIVIDILVGIAGGLEMIYSDNTKCDARIVGFDHSRALPTTIVPAQHTHRSKLRALTQNLHREHYSSDLVPHEYIPDLFLHKRT